MNYHFRQLVRAEVRDIRRTQLLIIVVLLLQSIALSWGAR